VNTKKTKEATFPLSVIAELTTMLLLLLYTAYQHSKSNSNNVDLYKPELVAALAQKAVATGHKAIATSLRLKEEERVCWRSSTTWEDYCDYQ